MTSAVQGHGLYKKQECFLFCLAISDMTAWLKGK